MNRAVSRLLFAVLTFSAACGVDPQAAPDDDPAVTGVTQAVTLTQVSSFGSNPGALQMFKYVPAGLPAGAPLVVMMHGCTESASSISTQSEWGNLADRFKFAVVFPQTSSSNNSQSCFNWFQPGDIARDQGEALSIKQMIDNMKSVHGIDGTRVFAAGMSAGAYMTTVMMAAYPDVIAAGAVSSGGPYACATSLVATNNCLGGSLNNTPAQWGNLVRNAFPGYTGKYPRLVAFQGSSDFTVSPKNLQWNVDQWSNVLGVDETPEVNETFRTSTHNVYRDASGRAMIETYLISGMGHALTVDPGTAVDQGGTTGAFAEDHDIYSSYYAAQFFGLLGAPGGGGGGGGGGDTTAPTVSITSPGAGAAVSGTITVAATASDNVGVARVNVLVDGNVAGSDASAPFAVSINTATLANGSHTLTARAIDAANNTGTSAAVAITVQNGTDGGGGGGGGGGQLETFSTTAGPDNPGWSLGGWTLQNKDATGVAGSRSIGATASPRFNTATQTATWSNIVLGAAPKLSYQRTLSLSDANVTASSSLSVIINDGADHVVDSKAISGFTSYSEASFTARTNIDLAAFAGKTVTLKLVITASDSSSIVTSASATIDQIQIR